MPSPTGKAGIIIGILSLIALVVIYGTAQGSIDEANDIRKNGYYYEGTSVVTPEQFEYIKQYNGQHGGFVKIVSISPITVEYAFGSLEDFPYLEKQPWNTIESIVKPAISQIALPLLSILPIIWIIYGINTLGKGESAKETST